jgi:hypothetical protein
MIIVALFIIPAIAFISWFLWYAMASDHKGHKSDRVNSGLLKDIIFKHDD